MSGNGCLLPYEKAIVLNALYDALDELAFVIDKSNSTRGTLLVSLAKCPQTVGRIAVSPTSLGRQTLVEVFPRSDDGEQPEWATVLFDATQALLRRAGMEATE